MSDFETRRRQTAIRRGHIVSVPSGKRFEVEHAIEHIAYLAGEDEDIICRRRELNLSEDQLTKADKQTLAKHEQVCRLEFAETLSPLLQGYIFARVNVHDGNRAAYEVCRTLEYGTTLFIHGPPGNGKTMLAVATAYRFAPYYTVAVWGVVDLFSAIRASFSPHLGVERPNLRRPELLVLDDLGKTKASDFVYEELYGLINYRLEHGLTTIYTSNDSISNTAQKVSPDPGNLGALISRLGSGGRGERARSARAPRKSRRFVRSVALESWRSYHTRVITLCELWGCGILQCDRRQLRTFPELHDLTPIGW